MNIPKFISDLECMYQKDEIFKQIIHDFEALKQTLQKLETLIEMCAVKYVIIEHIHMLIVLAYQGILSGKKLQECYKGHMLHTVFYGSPGVGKSRTARYLAEIWKALGILQNSVIENKILTVPEILFEINSIREVFLNLYEKHKKDPKTAFKNTTKEWEFLKESLKNFGENVSVSKEISTPKDDAIIICGREDFVAEYAGQTSTKTLNFLKSNIGKYIIIEEAYLLYNGEMDTYGMEAITVLNRWMDEHSDACIIIFTGYEELLHKTIFKAQPGLKRRCQWVFNLQGYSALGLSQIFENQLKHLGWKLAIDINPEDFFKDKMEKFNNYGGDTERLALHCKLKHSGNVFRDIRSSIEENKKITTSDLQFEITKDILEQAYQEYLKHKI